MFSRQGRPASQAFGTAPPGQVELHSGDMCMSIDSVTDVQRDRAVQVGFVMRSYRENFVHEDGRRGLSQEELLRKMGGIDTGYARRYSHATVSRWESGFTRPTVERLVVFSRALGLSQLETEGLLAMAGLASTLPGTVEPAGPADWAEDDSDPDPLPSQGGGEQLAREVGCFLLFRVILVGFGIALCGYAISLPGWNVFPATAACFGLASVLVLGQGFVFADKENPLRGFFWVSLFFVLGTPLLQFAPLGMDHYNLHFARDLFAPLMPCVVALLVNLVLASGAGLLFHVLWHWQYRSGRQSGSPAKKAIVVVLPSAGLVYGVVLVITTVSITVQLSVIIPVFSAVVVVLLVLNDPRVVLANRDRRLMYQGTFVVGFLSTLVGMGVIVGVFLSPDYPAVLPDHNLVGQWEIDFEELGLSREEALDRVNLGYVLHGVVVSMYMFIAVSGRLVVSIHQDGRGEVRAPPS